MTAPPFLGRQTSAFTRYTTGTISGDGDVVALYCPNSSAITVDVQGTFDGRIAATGAFEIGGPEGGRILFQSGVGSTAINFVDGGGVARAAEYRAVGGGEYFIIRGSNWVSGSVTITIYAQEAQSITFINGPVHTAQEQAVRAGQAFVASTGVQDVEAGNVIVMTFENPAGSGVNVHLRNRLFGNNRGPTSTNLEYTAYASPSFVPANTENGINLRGAVPFSTSIFRWEVRSQIGLVIGGTEGSGEVLPNGTTYSRPLEVMILPGRSVGFVINGAGNNLANAARVSMTLEWYEEDI